MIIEKERDENEATEFDYSQIDENPPIQVSQEQTHEFTTFTKSHQHIKTMKFILNSNQTSLISYGNYKASCKNLSV